MARDAWWFVEFRISDFKFHSKVSFIGVMPQVSTQQQKPSGTTNEGVGQIRQASRTELESYGQKFNHEFSRILRISRIVNRHGIAGDGILLIVIRDIRRIRENSVRQAKPG